MTWWGHTAHEQVEDMVVDRLQRRVHEGMGLVVLHSGHGSKIFRRFMGMMCMLRWREAAERERLWCVGLSPPLPTVYQTNFLSWIMRKCTADISVCHCRSNWCLLPSSKVEEYSVPAASGLAARAGFSIPVLDTKHIRSTTMRMFVAYWPTGWRT